jgi:uncharacterized C2H2 Zn-finger protein
MKLHYTNSKLVAEAESLQDIKTLLALGDPMPAVSEGVTTRKSRRVKGVAYARVGRPKQWPTCTTCGAKFRSFAALREHLKAAHNLEVNITRPSDNARGGKKNPLEKRGRSSDRVALPCPVCGEVFVGYKALANHLRATHKMSKVQLAARGIFLTKRSGAKAYRPGSIQVRPTTNYLEDNTAEAQAALAKERSSFISA